MFQLPPAEVISRRFKRATCFFVCLLFVRLFVFDIQKQLCIWGNLESHHAYLGKYGAQKRHAEDLKLLLQYRDTL